MKMRQAPLSVLMMVLLVMLSACAKNPVTGKRQLMLMSEGQEVALGAGYDPQVLATFGDYKHDVLLNFIIEKGQEMGKISHRPNLDYHFRILDSPVINAFAVPGGYIYFTRGILAHFNNEAEMMGVLAHEMGHITARHSVSRQSKQQLGQLLLIGGMIASEAFRDYAGYAMQGMQLLFLKYSRDDEREADKLGVEYTAKIGYDAQRFADFFKMLIRMNLASDHGGVPTFLSTHPDPGDRYNDVKSHALEWRDKLGLEDWKVNTDNYLRMIDGIVYGEDPRQGYTDGNTFHHPELKFLFPIPAGWKLENSPMQVRMAPSDGKALIIFALAQGGSLDEAAATAVKDLQLTVEASDRKTVNGMPAIVVRSVQVSQDQQTGQQQEIAVVSYFIDDNGMYYVFHGVSLKPDFNTYLGSFQTTMDGFARLTDPARINVVPEKVQIKTVARAGSLRDAFVAFSVPQARMEEFAFLNNMELTDAVTAGQLIKIAGK